MKKLNTISIQLKSTYNFLQGESMKQNCIIGLLLLIIIATFVNGDSSINIGLNNKTYINYQNGTQLNIEDAPQIVFLTSDNNNSPSVKAFPTPPPNKITNIKEDNDIVAKNWFEYGNGNFVLMQDYAKALDGFNHAILFNQSYAEAWYSKGLVLHLLGRIDEEMDAYNQAIIIDPGYYSAWHAKGQELLSWGDYEGALIAYSEAIKNHPYDSNSQTEIGIIQE